jgi:hypothetical protein
MGKSPVQGFGPDLCGEAAQRIPGLTSAEISQYPVTILDAYFIFTSSPHLATAGAVLQLSSDSGKPAEGGFTPASCKHQQSVT